MIVHAHTCTHTYMPTCMCTHNIQTHAYLHRMQLHRIHQQTLRLLTFTGELRPLPTHVKSTYNCHNRSGFGKYLLTMHALMKMIFTVKLQHNISMGLVLRQLWTLLTIVRKMVHYVIADWYHLEANSM